MPTNPQIAQIDIRPERLGRRSKLDLGLCGDVGDTIQALLPLVKPKADRAFLDAMLEQHDGRAAEAPRLRRSRRQAAADPPRVRRRHAGRTGRPGRRVHHRHRDVRRLGRPLPAAPRRAGDSSARSTTGRWPTPCRRRSARRSAYPGRQVISLSGDGGLAMMMGELLTIAQYELPVKIVLFNNHRLGMVQLEMEAAGLPHYGCELKNPNFAALAQAVGLMGIAGRGSGGGPPRAGEGAGVQRAGPGGRGDRPERPRHAAEGDGPAGQPQEPISVNRLDFGAFTKLPGGLAVLAL